jgi:hypothetical protein
MTPCLPCQASGMRFIICVPFPPSILARQLLPITSTTMGTIPMVMHRKGNIEKRQPMSAVLRRRMPLVYTICMEMCGNGVLMIGTIVIKERQKPSGDRIFLFCQIGFKLFGRALTRLNIDVAKNVERFFATSILATFP